MNSDKQASLLIGSPRGKGSTSESLGFCLLEQLEMKGIETETVHIQKSLKTMEGQEKMLSAVNNSDIIILAFPLYVDTLPAPVIQTMELILEHRKSGYVSKKSRLVAIVNSGLPEPNHSHIALANCKIFCTEVGIEWAGGLAIGGGEAIAGRALGEVKGMARKVIKALDFAGETLVKGEPVPKEALELASRPIVPKWLYVFAGTRRWKRKAKKNGASKRMYDTPYGRN
ncbi:MAG: hypothetical protein KAW09_05855 [Thermoplasmata archaeon]|nr:hypothetical protein [Thermoplasmata archaeon]